MLHDRPTRYPHGPLCARLLSTRWSTRRASALPRLFSLAPEDNLTVTPKHRLSVPERRNNRACIYTSGAGARGGRDRIMQFRFYEIPHFRSAGRSCWKLIPLYDNKFSLFLITRVPGPRPCGHDGPHERRLETLLESMSMLTLSGLTESPDACLAAAGTRSWAAARSERSAG